MANGSHRFSGENQNIDNLARWFEVNRAAIEQYKQQILNGIITPEEFLGMTHRQVGEYFSDLLKELEFSFCLNMIAAIEARFKMDYIVRATDKLKDDLSREFRDIYKEKKENVGLEEVILESWKKHHVNLKNHISFYIGALKYRHWLAHGRYWNPKLGQKYDYTSVYLICSNILNQLSFCI
ncbi:hypothetical protein [Aneurinibacillus tyrosinisolvens]|uniref:hypothetical protein n=1 Tax=Aneurinibacillus tyrosinisolvens TaxID=1443435 RepID=UPI00063FB6B2|nr:hypothetical protein [Aneurinibacillus tyrosinisolvens]